MYSDEAEVVVFMNREGKTVYRYVYPDTEDEEG